MQTIMSGTFAIVIDGEIQTLKNLQGGPWRYFVDAMKTNDWTLTECSTDNKLILFVGHAPHSRAYKYSEPTSRVLMLWEPPATEPLAYKKRVSKCYRKILVPFPLHESYNYTKYFNWPQNFSESRETCSDWSKRRGVVMMQSNKFSFVKSELYSLRRDTLTELGTKYNFTLYGKDWNITKKDLIRKVIGASKKSRKIGFPKNALNQYSFYQGVSKDKFLDLQKHVISIVIENDLGYISEKLFDAISCQTIPVYVGPKLAKIGLSDLNFLQAEPNISSIEERLDNLFEMKPKRLHELSLYVQDKALELRDQLNHETIFHNLAKLILP